MSHSCVCRSLSNLNFGPLKESRECFLVTSFFCSAFFSVQLWRGSMKRKKDHCLSSLLLLPLPPLTAVDGSLPCHGVGAHDKSRRGNRVDIDGYPPPRGRPRRPASPIAVQERHSAAASGRHGIATSPHCGIATRAWRIVAPPPPGPPPPTPPVGTRSMANCF